jgi:predicted ATP-grasp superfamily ATP-dependent carboligase
MRDPRELYQLSEDLSDLGRPVLVHALHGFVDAGSAGRLAREHIIDVLSGRPIAEFEMDELFDYRSRRPLMRFNADHWEQYDAPSLTLHALVDDAEVPFLLLSGAEPDLQWERFIAAVESLVTMFGVRSTIGIHAIPMAVPHTRPVGITAHATRPDLISGYEPWFQRVQVPASMTNLLEFRLGEHGLDAIGFAAHVPNYLAETEYHPAAEALLTAVSRATGLLLPTDGLRESGEQMRLEVERQLANNEQAESVVRALEEQYDAFSRGRSANLLSTGPELPTADELGAELERFLAEHHRDNE